MASASSLDVVECAERWRAPLSRVRACGDVNDRCARDEEVTCGDQLFERDDCSELAPDVGRCRCDDPADLCPFHRSVSDPMPRHDAGLWRFERAEGGHIDASARGHWRGHSPQDGGRSVRDEVALTQCFCHCNAALPIIERVELQCRMNNIAACDAANVGGTQPLRRDPVLSELRSSVHAGIEMKWAATSHAVSFKLRRYCNSPF